MMLQQLELDSTTKICVLSKIFYVDREMQLTLKFLLKVDTTLDENFKLKSVLHVLFSDCRTSPLILTVPLHSDFHIPKGEAHLIGRDSLHCMYGLQGVHNYSIYLLFTFINLQ